MPSPSTPASLHTLPASPTVLLRTPGGSVRAFRFAAGEGLPEHATPHEALVVVVQGEVTVTLEGTSHTLHAGGTMLFPATVPHAVEAATNAVMLLVLLHT